MPTVVTVAFALDAADAAADADADAHAASVLFGVLRWGCSHCHSVWNVQRGYPVTCICPLLWCCGQWHLCHFGPRHNTSAPHICTAHIAARHAKYGDTVHLAQICKSQMGVLHTSNWIAFCGCLLTQHAAAYSIPRSNSCWQPPQHQRQLESFQQWT